MPKTQAIRERRESQPAETQQQTADAVGCDQGFVSKVVSGMTKKCETQEKVICHDWITDPHQQANCIAAALLPPPCLFSRRKRPSSAACPRPPLRRPLPCLSPRRPLGRLVCRRRRDHGR